MAYVVLHSLTQTIRQILNHDKIPACLNIKRNLELLLQQVVRLRQFLEKSPEEAKTLETTIREAANGAEDVIEHFMYDHIRSPATDHIQYDFDELNKVMVEIDSIARKITTGKFSDTPAKQPAPRSSPLPAPPIDSFTVGLDKDLETLNRMVVGGDPNRRIFAITGMVGSGKTALANKFYHNKSVTDVYPTRGWVTVSRDYKPENILADLLCSLKGVDREGSVESVHNLVDEVHKFLSMKRYLIVLDGLWSKRAWEEIKMAFPEGWSEKINTRRIVITTTDENVAPPCTLHRMKSMDQKPSWELLKQKVFPNKQCPSKLEKVGNDIATACQGLPLAIVVIARILSTIGDDPSSWKKVAKDVRALIQKDKEFQKRISLSYTDLPLHLRPCLLYMATFPDDHHIRVSKLIKLWAAEGFVEHEEEAETFLNELIKRSLVFVTTTKSNGRMKSCNLNIFLRDFCRTIALGDNLERRLSNAHPDLRCLAKAYASTVRSVVCFQPTKSSLLGLRKLRLLRVLDVVDTHAYSLPPQVFELFHLRYLAFGCSLEIPAVISKFHNLRTLIIRPSKGFRRHSKDEVYLPIEIWAMPLLEHLVSFFDLLPNPKEGASPLKNLRTLSVVKKLICTEKMMSMIPNVKKLGITYFGDEYKEDYQLENLALLHQLEKLTLVFKEDHPATLTNNPVFPKSLRNLTLSGWRFSWYKMGTICGSLPELQVLKLKDHACEGSMWETREDQFLKLEYLHIDSSNIEEWVFPESPCQFQNLRCLVIHRCPLLREIPEDLKHTYTLNLIDVEYRYASLMKCINQIQEYYQDYHDDSLQVRAVYYEGS